MAFKEGADISVGWVAAASNDCISTVWVLIPLSAPLSWYGDGTAATGLPVGEMKPVRSPAKTNSSMKVAKAEATPKIGESRRVG